MAGLAAAIRGDQGNYHALDVMPPAERQVPARAAVVHAVALQTVVGKRSVDERGAETVTLVLKGSEVEEKDKRQVQCDICSDDKDEVLSHEPFLHASTCQECLPRLLEMKDPPECPHCRIEITHENGEAHENDEVYEAAPPRAAPRQEDQRDERGTLGVLVLEGCGATAWGMGQIILDSHLVVAIGSFALVAGLTASSRIDYSRRRHPLNFIAKLVTVAVITAGVATGSAPLAIAGVTFSAVTIAKDFYTLVKAARA